MKWNRKTFTVQKNTTKNLDVVLRRLRARRIPRVALHDTAECAWIILYHSGDDQAMITLTGLDFTTFNWLEGLFTQMHDNYSPFISPEGRIKYINNNGGCKQLLEGTDCLALMLAWTRTQGSNFVLQMIFGMMVSTSTPDLD
jgi:hypothetical protein